jgi:hypothetical protein
LSFIIDRWIASIRNCQAVRASAQQALGTESIPIIRPLLAIKVHGFARQRFAGSELPQ